MSTPARILARKAVMSAVRVLDYPEVILMVAAFLVVYTLWGGIE